jgi:metalloendopeptidase OMA1, mitochondrial
MSKNSWPPLLPICNHFGCHSPLHHHAPTSPASHARRQFLQTASLLALAGCAGDMAGGGGFQPPVLLSSQEEARLGDEAWAEITQKQPLSGDRRRQRQIERVATRLIDTTGTGYLNWEFALFDDDKVNAFALPGGKVGVYTGLFKVAENDAQLGAVLGHEITHVKARHAAKRISTQMLGNAALKIAEVGLQGAGVGSAGQIAGLIGAGVSYGVILPFSRRQEMEADALGLEAMAKAAYDPREAVNFWQKMGTNGQKAPSWAQFASTHPADGTRIQALNGMLPRVMPLYEQAEAQERT